MAAGEEFKSVFQTHNGHYEYRVMPYGVTGGPTTFQTVMNVILAPLLRKCVVVFIDDILIYSKSWEDHLLHIREVLIILQQTISMSRCQNAHLPSNSLPSQTRPKPQTQGARQFENGATKPLHQLQLSRSPSAAVDDQPPWC
jgi:hypothetical protein